MHKMIFSACQQQSESVLLGSFFFMHLYSFLLESHNHFCRENGEREELQKVSTVHHTVFKSISQNYVLCVESPVTFRERLFILGCERC